MKTGVILVQKFNIGVIDFELVETFHKKVKDTLPANIKAVIIPHTWEFKQVDDKVIYIGMDMEIDLDTSARFIEMISETLGEDYTIVKNVCKAEVINEY